MVITKTGIAIIIVLGINVKAINIGIVNVVAPNPLTLKGEKGEKGNMGT